MDLWTIIKVTVRRWYVVLPVMIVTAGLAYELAYKAPPTYRANGSALLVAPNVVTGVTGEPVKQNPYLLFSGSLNITASAVVRILNDTAVRGDYIEAGLLGSYEIGVEPSTPTIGVTVEGDSEQVVLATVRRLLDDIKTRLVDVQNAARAPSDLRIGTSLLVEPTKAETLRGQVARTMATIGVLGLLAAVALALLLEAAVTTRRRSKAERLARSEAQALEAGEPLALVAGEEDLLAANLERPREEAMRASPVDLVDRVAVRGPDGVDTYQPTAEPGAATGPVEPTDRVEPADGSRGRSPAADVPPTAPIERPSPRRGRAAASSVVEPATTEEKPVRRRAARAKLAAPLDDLAQSGTLLAEAQVEPAAGPQAEAGDELSTATPRTGRQRRKVSPPARDLAAASPNGPSPHPVDDEPAATTEADPAESPVGWPLDDQLEALELSAAGSPRRRSRRKRSD